MIRKEAKRKAARLTGKGLWGKSAEQLLQHSPDREPCMDEGNVVEARTKRIRARSEVKEVWYGGVRMKMPWGRGRNWDKAVSRRCNISAGEN